jgi:putative membrane protein
MLIELIIFILAGIAMGTLTGLIPGVHINLISIIVISISVSLLSQIPPIYIITFIVSMSITHTFIDFIPSVFLGCPDVDTELSVLPGHELLKEGHGYQAIMLTLYGSIAAIILLLVFSFPFGFLIKKFYNVISKTMPFILILILIILILLERKKLNSIIVIITSGILGLIVLNIPSQNLNQPFLPLLTGLFGISNLILSIKNKTKIPKQKIQKPKTKLTKPLFGALISSPICTILPGLGAGQAAIIGHTISNSKNDKKGFLVLLGATNTLVMGFSFITLYLISKTRTGSALAIQDIIGTIDLKTTILIISIILISGIIAYYLAEFIARFSSKNIQKIDYIKLSIGTIIFISILTIIVSKFLGLMVLIISTITGIFCISLKVRRTNMMGVLMIPTILFYLKFNLF